MIYHTHNNKAFTIIELMVSISIMTVLLFLVLYNYRAFSNRLAVSGASQEVATAIRQTQSYRLSVQESAPGSGDFTTPYGLYIKRPDFVNPGTSYIIFADRDLDGIYDGSRIACNAGTECLQKIDIRDGVSVGYVRGTGGGACDPTYTDAMTVIFSRASLDAEVAMLNTSQTKTLCNSVTISVYKKDPSSGTLLSDITFDKTGQMTIAEPKACGTPTTIARGSYRMCNGFQSGDSGSGGSCVIVPVQRVTTWSLCPGLETVEYQVRM